VIDAVDSTEQQAFEQLMAGRSVTQVSFYLESSEWQPQERYDAPDGNYYAALWPLGERLAILQPGGEVVSEVYAANFGPSSADCSLTPIRWLPDSRGVLFTAYCYPVERAILLLSIPDS
jgi:hypothetical protein